MSHTFQNNTEDLSAGERTYKKRVKTQLNYARLVSKNAQACLQNQNFRLEQVSENSKVVRKITNYENHALFMDLNKAKTLPTCNDYEDKFDLSLCDVSFSQATGVETGNNLNDILNTMIFDGTDVRALINYDPSGANACGIISGDVSGVNIVNCSGEDVFGMFIDPSGTLHNNNCSSVVDHLGLVRDGIVQYDNAMVPIANLPIPFSNRHYKNRFNNVNLHSGVYFNN